ncbi:MAG: phosphatase PAP2 family protein [Lachnospiraceae bacterium]|nr:phosphatase PAP2 family protein [Lachnospiraceae bacterium]
MEAFFELDGNILLWIQEYIRNDFLTPIFKFITHLGDEGYVWIAIAVLLLFVKNYRKVGLMVGGSLLGSLLFNNMIVKNIVARPRPYRMMEELTILIPEPGEYSFPSGHTSSSFAAGVVLYLMLPKKYGIPAMVLAFLIGISRLYVGVHYPTDVLGGMVMGALLAVETVKITEVIEKKVKK